MSKQTTMSAFNLYSRLAGRYNTLAPFHVMSGKQQSMTGSGNNIDLQCFNTKVYTTTKSFETNLNNGFQDGQLKKITLVMKGKEDTTVTVHCPSLQQNLTQIVLSNVGDQVLLMWNAGYWVVLETLNITDPSLQTPVIE